MNDMDILRSLSGIDPKYIDEAAFELHENVAVEKRTADDGKADESQTIENRKVVDITHNAKMRRFLTISLPAVAAVILIVGVVFPAILRVTGSKNQAAYDAAPSAASEAPASEAPAAAAAESAEAEDALAVEEAEPMAEEPMAEASEEAMPEAAADSAAETAGTYDANADTAPAHESLGYNKTEEQKEEAIAAAAEDSAGEAGFVLSNAVYEKGILSVEISGDMPLKPEEMQYEVIKANGAGSGEIASGIVSDIMKTDEKKKDAGGGSMRLDLSTLDMRSGNYILVIGNSTVGFTVP